MLPQNSISLQEPIPPCFSSTPFNQRHHCSGKGETPDFLKEGQEIQNILIQYGYGPPSRKTHQISSNNGTPLFDESESEQKHKLYDRLLTLQEELCKVKLEVMKRKMQSELLDLIHPAFIDEKTNKLETLINHVQEISSKKQNIINYLMNSPSNYIVIEYQYQKHLQDMIKTMGKLITSAEEITENYEWLVTHKNDKRLINLPHAMKQVFLSLESSFLNLKEFFEKSKILFDLKSENSKPLKMLN